MSKSKTLSSDGDDGSRVGGRPRARGGSAKSTLLVMTGPSGCGKSTILKRLFELEPQLALSVSHTTRPPRPGETNGQDYHFVGDNTFSAMVEAGRFAEWAAVHAHRYGTSRDEITRLQELRKDIVFDIDVQGAEQLCAAYPEAVSVFIVPPTMAVLEQRLRGCNTEDETQLRIRLDNARREIERAPEYDYAIVNRDLDAAVVEFRAILKAERRRGARIKAMTDRLLREAPRTGRGARPEPANDTEDSDA